MKDIIEILTEVASKPCASDWEDFNPMECSGGNYDDAYDMGRRHGKTEFARHLLNELGIEFTIEKEE